MAMATPEKEWILTAGDVSVWRSKARRLKNDALPSLKKFLSSNKLRIGSQTFTSGLTELMYELLCAQKKSADKVTSSRELTEYLAKACIREKDVNQSIRFNPRPSASQDNVSDRLAVVMTTLVHGAVTGACLPILKLLVSAGASLDQTDCCGRVPLMLAIEAQDQDVLQFLLDREEVVQLINNRDCEGLTPLMYLTREPSMSHFIPVIVLEKGADMFIKDNRGFTALHMAVYEGTTKAVAELLKLVKAGNHEDRYTAVPPHPSVLFKCRSKAMEVEFKSKRAAIFASFKDCFPPAQQVDMLQVDAALHLLDCLQYSGIAGLPFYKHAMAEALVLKKELGIATNKNTEEYESFDVFKEFVIDSKEDENQQIKNEIKQVLLVLRRCLGNDSKTLFDYLKHASSWLVQKEEHSHAYTLLIEMSDILVSTTSSHAHSNTGYMQTMTGTLMGYINTLFYTTQSHGALKEHLKEIDFIDAELSTASLTPIFHNLAKAINYCTEHAKRVHSHKLPAKSTSILVTDFLHLLNSIILQRVSLVIEYNSIISSFISQCPSVIIDINGNPTTLLHIALSIGPELAQAFLENGAERFINDVGPCGNRPIQTVYNPDMLELLLDYGAHLDAVNKLGKRVCESIQPFLGRPLSVAPLRLSCICCAHVARDAVVPYLTMDIPNKVKQQILLHDKRAEQVLLQEELVFI